MAIKKEEVVGKEQGYEKSPEMPKSGSSMSVEVFEDEYNEITGYLNPNSGAYTLFIPIKVIDEGDSEGFNRFKIMQYVGENGEYVEDNWGNSSYDKTEKLIEGLVNCAGEEAVDAFNKLFPTDNDFFDERLVDFLSEYCVGCQVKYSKVETEEEVTDRPVLDDNDEQRMTKDGDPIFYKQYNWKNKGKYTWLGKNKGVVKASSDEDSEYDGDDNVSF